MNYLIVDDDIRVYNLIGPYLNSHEKLIYLDKLDNVFDVINDNEIKLIILDIEIKQQNGLSFFVDYKTFFLNRKIPVFFLSQSSQLKDKLTAFQLGAYDYIQKPFEPLELMARIRSKLAQSNQLQVGIEDYYIKEDLHFNLKSHTLYFVKDSIKTEVILSTKEFKLLLFLIKREGQIFSRQQILDQIWGENLNVTERNVDQHISKIRKKIKASSFCLKTHFNLGYSIESIDLQHKKYA